MSSLSSCAAIETNAIDLLVRDHQAVTALVAKYCELAHKGFSGNDRRFLARRICAMLRVHAQIEEEIFYPEARLLLADTGLVDAEVGEYAGAKALVAEIEHMAPDDDFFDAKVRALGEFVDHHVQEEEGELFPKIRRRMDLDEVGARLKARREELLPPGHP